MEDYRDQLKLEPALQEALRGRAAPGQDPAVELQQCLFLNVARALLRTKGASVASEEAVQHLACRLRARAHRLALEAESALGEWPDQLTPAEADLRAFCHACLHRDHDKDYRALLAFPLPELATVALHVVRVDY